MLTVAYKFYQLEQLYNTKGEQAFTDRKNNLYNGLGDFYKDFSAKVDEKVFEQLIALYATKVPKQFLPNSLNTIDVNQLTKTFILVPNSLPILVQKNY